MTVLLILIAFVAWLAFQFLSIRKEDRFNLEASVNKYPHWVYSLSKRELRLYRLLIKLKVDGNYRYHIHCQLYRDKVHFLTLLKELKDQVQLSEYSMKAIIGKKACTLLVNSRTNPFRFIRTRLHHLFHSIKSVPFLRKASFKKPYSI